MPFTQPNWLKSWFSLKNHDSWSPVTRCSKVSKGLMQHSLWPGGYRGLTGGNQLGQSIPGKGPELEEASQGKTESTSGSPSSKEEKEYTQKHLHPPSLPTQGCQELSGDSRPWCDLFLLFCFLERHLHDVPILYVIMYLRKSAFTSFERNCITKAKPSPGYLTLSTFDI